ncbi:MAG: hypothetical protein IPM51_06945 [Sphingobacteriaceae bacterium]|nr:hypothetical protein [Sphingobacteriaceae bacterium]
MQNIGILELLYDEYEFVNYYTIRLEIDDVKEELNETEKFIQNFDDPNHTHFGEFDAILRVIDGMGNYTKGAELRLFRFEEAAHALPPKVKDADAVLDIEIILHSELRLYCIRLTNEVVVLLNGGVKITDSALDCPNVKQHFRFAQAVAKNLDKLRREGVIDIVGKEILNLTNDDEILLYL